MLLLHVNEAVSAERLALARRVPASSSDDGPVRLWDVATGTQTAILKGPTHGVRAVAFSPDGQ
ncbi:MAG: hypothetical protein LC777_05525 [Actinobacteria bacterium]|nr:hypothetical protein [Actinomycetota bacterium]